jgi:hypothetical protein
MPVADRAGDRDPEPLPAPASEARIAEAEKEIGRELPAALRRLYADIADGGFGPGGGLFGLVRAAEEYKGMTREPAGPQNQPWPSNLLPLSDREPGYDCLDLDSGQMIAWDPEEIDGYSDAAWRRSFKYEASDLAAWLEEWLGRPTAGERLQGQRQDDPDRNPMTIHVRNMLEFYSKMTPEERARHQLPGIGWEDEVRRRHGQL